MWTYDLLTGLRGSVNPVEAAVAEGIARACELAALANKIAAQIPRGHRNIADHLLRSASNTVLLLAEGANRTLRNTETRTGFLIAGRVGEDRLRAA